GAVVDDVAAARLAPRFGELAGGGVERAAGGIADEQPPRAAAGLCKPGQRPGGGRHGQGDARERAAGESDHFAPRLGWWHTGHGAMIATPRVEWNCSCCKGKMNGIQLTPE